jgi:hypothetical protein
MRRLGGILFLLMLAACQPHTDSTTLEAAAPTTTSGEAVATTSSSAPASTSTTTAPSTTSTTVGRTTTTPAPATTRPATRVVPLATTTTVATAVTGSGCDPNYSGACVPIASDVDCSRSANGPAYVDAKNIRVVGTDIYDLDRNGDGIACEG